MAAGIEPAQGAPEGECALALATVSAAALRSREKRAAVGGCDRPAPGTRALSRGGVLGALGSGS